MAQDMRIAAINAVAVCISSNNQQQSGAGQQTAKYHKIIKKEMGKDHKLIIRRHRIVK